MSRKEKEIGGTLTVEELKGLLPALTSTEFSLPSNGFYYDKDLVPNGKVKLLPMDARCMKILKGMRNSTIDEVIDIVLERCLLTKIPIEDLLVGDRFFLLLMLRANSYGSVYPVDLTCPFCEAQAKYEVDFYNDFMVEIAEDIEPYAITLPDSKVNISFRLLRGKDIKAIRKYEAEQNKLGYNTGGDVSFEYRLARQLVTVQGRPIDVVVGMEFINGLSAKDVEFYSQMLEKKSPGVDTTITKTCVSCKKEITAALPMTADFFRPELTGV